MPQSSSFNWQYWGAGCVYSASGASGSAHTLQLPDGAEITYLRIYLYDSDPINDAYVNLYAFDAQGNSTFIGMAESSGAPGWSSVGSGFLSHFVNNVNEALHLKLGNENSDDDTLRICGVRVQYQYSLARTSLPLVLNESNP